MRQMKCALTTEINAMMYWYWLRADLRNGLRSPHTSINEGGGRANYAQAGIALPSHLGARKGLFHPWVG